MSSKPRTPSSRVALQFGGVFNPPVTADRARRMRAAATGLLVLMAGVFLAARYFHDLHPAWGFVEAFAEAAMVGGLADWFAVTALFRHPMGVPIPHTAIIPENKDRIADTMAVFLQENFLTPQVVARRMQSMNMAAAMGQFLTDPEGKEANSRIRAGASELFADVLESLDPDKMGDEVRAGLKSQLAKLNVAPLLGQMLSAAIADGRHMPLLDSFIRWAALTLEDNEDMVRNVIHERANALLRITGLDETVANSILDGLYKLLAETLVDPKHPIRTKAEEGLAQLAHDLQHDPAMQEKVQRMKQEVLDNPALGNWWQSVWERLRKRMLEAARNPDAKLSGQLAESLADLGKSLESDPRIQAMVNRFARRTAVGVSTRYGGQIVQLVSETVRRWDAGQLTDRIEGAVGRDLQFIRVNGTLVGGLVGLTIHTITVLVS